ncbi:MAG: hypothetical protein Q4D26_07750 [Clostridia bacterium]|nr:hypothetical protein [Clostridia bacterium]
MATKTTNYKLTKPAQTDYYNVNDFNNNMDIIDATVKANSNSIEDMPIHRKVIKTSKISSSDLTKGEYIVIAEKGHYSNGSAFILVEASGSLTHHSMVLTISCSFSTKPTITCLCNSAYATPLFDSAVIETVWSKQHIVCLRLNNDISTQSPVEFKVTVISEWWDINIRPLGTYTFTASNMKSVQLQANTTAFDGYLPKTGGYVSGAITVNDDINISGDINVDTDINASGNINTDDTINAYNVKSENNMVIKNRTIARAIELYNSPNVEIGGYIDFHYNQEITEENQTANTEGDYTARIIENAPGELNVQASSNYIAKLKVAGNQVYDNSRIMVRTTDNVTAGVSPLSQGNIILVVE